MRMSVSEMRAFRFPLQKALELRRTQLDLEEAQVPTSKRRRWRRWTGSARFCSSSRTARGGAGARSCDGSRARIWPRSALSAWRTGAEEKRIAQRRAEGEKELEDAAQRHAGSAPPLPLAGAAEGAAQAEWSAEAAKELEELAAESYLAQWRGTQPLKQAGTTSEIMEWDDPRDDSF